MSYGMYRDIIQAEGAELLSPREIDFFRFATTDYMVFDVDKDVFAESKVILDLIEGLSIQNGDNTVVNEGITHKINSDPIQIPFSACDFKRCLDYWTEGEIDPPLCAEDIVLTWRIADYFNIDRLKKKLIAELGNILKADMNSVRRRLCIKSDYTKEEETQMKLEDLDGPISEEDF